MLAGKIRYLRPGAFLPDIVTSNALAQSLRFWFARFRSRALLIPNGYFRPMAASSHCTFHSSRLNPGTTRFRTLQNISIRYKLTYYILSFAVTKINTVTISTTPQSNVRIKCRMLQNVFIIVSRLLFTDLSVFGNNSFENTFLTIQCSVDMFLKRLS